MIVYLITNTSNGKQYVGMTKATLEERWKRHLKSVKRRSTTYLHNAIRKYGEAAFKREILLACGTWEAAICHEKFYIRLFDLRNTDKGYNLSDGGEGPNGYKHSEESRQKMRDARKCNPRPSPWKGKTRSSASCRKMSVAAKKRVGELNNHFGHQHSLETRQANAEWHRVNGHKNWTPERRAALSKKIKELRAIKFWSTKKKVLGVS